ncbi:sarcolemma associated protein a isoform X6 [Latimeria chalumnae]|uniref:sarcolemma associated protein a isoform X6 n=1 Tax=Latimeria chalumnae TaxID=7897 RepID=UPI00313DD6CF
MPSALAIFTCRPNSHPFQERHVYLDEPVKIGRSVARCRPAQNNATFDCKVLSRNHALVWFDHKAGKFYLQDTKSSNGTFINSQRLSRGSEESPPCEILSGDIIQFGVDVTENTRKGKVTHGCIVSTIKLFLPDGMEARRRSDVIQAPLPLPVEKVAANSPSMYSQELFQLSQYLQEALHREQMLEQKLATLQRLLASTQEASDSSWQALIDEDRLLSRLEVMGNQLQAYSKNQTEDGIRKELVALQEDKHNYETTAKESLRRVLQEKIEVVRKLSEVERSLSNTEDECTHLKEMNERTQEELKELANKYNGAVNEIKDLSDKLKQAEGRQEEILQKGLTEKKELQFKIDEMEEKEQELQAKIEALQADNDFTNERLTALQVRLEQLQEKNIKEHRSLDARDSCVENNQTAEENLSSPERLKAKLIDEEHLTKAMEETKPLKENQVEAKESDLSDTLSPSKDKSSDDTTDSQMDEQELNESLTKVSLLKGELRRAHLETGETEHEIQQLRKELIEAQELARTSKQKCIELQALLEEERKANRQQAQDSTRQIQVLQVHLQKLQEDIETFRDEKENEITRARDELGSAQEQIALLRQVVEDTTVERENDIAALQVELRIVRADLEQWRKAALEYETEIASLQATLQLQSQERENWQKAAATQLQVELETLKRESDELHTECLALKKENVVLTEKLQQQEKEIQSSQQQSVTLTNDIGVLEAVRKTLENQMGNLKEQHQRDANGLKSQLTKAENRAMELQKENEETQTVLSELKEKFKRTEQEKQSITDELRECKANLKLLQEKGNNPSILQPVPAIFIGLILTFLYWCFGPLW